MIPPGAELQQKEYYIVKIIEPKDSKRVRLCKHVVYKFISAQHSCYVCKYVCAFVSFIDSLSFGRRRILCVSLDSNHKR